MRLSEITEQQKHFIVLVGLPGSGKSTYISHLKKQRPYVVVSTDDIFEQLGRKQGLNYNTAFRAFDYKDVEQQMYNQLQQALKQNKNIIVDQTNLNVKSRARKLKLAPEHYKKIAIVFEVDPEELNQRLQKREKETQKHIPPDVIEKMRKSYQQPTKAEGFDEIVFV